MPLTQESIDELKQIHLDEYGEKLCNQEAWEMGINLIRLFKALVMYEQSDKVNDKKKL